MTKKIILNDNEVVFNEDVSAAQDWRSQDLNRSLEAMFQATFQTGSLTAGAVTAGAIMSGLLVFGSSSNLSVNITSGMAIFSFGGDDVTLNNRYRLASLDALTNILLPVAHPTLYRWDLIEVSAEEITTTETRQVLTSIGPTRALVPTVVPKTISSNLKFRVRSGVPASLATARLPSLQPDPAWLPLAAIKIAPGDLVTSVASGHTPIDLRKVFSYCSPERSLTTTTSALPGIFLFPNRDGFNSSVAMSSDGVMISAAPNWVHMGNYCMPILASVQQTFSNRPQINPNIDKPASLTLQVNRWYYVYAYRPTAHCGYTTMVLTSVPPIADDTVNRGRPSAAFDLPVPWPATDATAPAMYMGAVRLYDSGGTFFPLPFRKAGGYTALAYTSEGGFSGATTQGKIHSAGGGLIGPGITSTETINPDGDGFEAVPPHSRLVRLTFQFENISTSSDELNFVVRTNLTPPFLLYRVFDIDPDHMTTAEIDVPVDSTFSVSIICTGSTPADTGTWRGWVQGYYEEMP